MTGLIALIVMLAFAHRLVALRPVFKDHRAIQESTKRLLCTPGDDFDMKVQDTYDKMSKRRMIISEDNSKVKLVKSLQQKKKRDKESLVLLEGHRQVIDALRFGSRPRHIFITERGIDGPLGYSLMEALTFGCTDSLSEVDIISDTIMRKCFSDVENAQGVVASFARPNRETYLPSRGGEEGASDQPPLLVVLDRLADPGNMGTLIRSSFGFGADAVVVAEGCDPWAPKTIRSAMGTGLQLPVVETTWGGELLDILEKPSIEAVGRLYPSSHESYSGSQNQYQILIADCDVSAVPYTEIDYTQPTILVVGNEAHGPSPEALDLPCARKIYIPMQRDLESLNAAIAGSIILSEAARQRQEHR
jgi:TrmH family RNA methyltransferase